VNNLNVGWHTFTTISALCAYDWIYNDLTAEERTEFGRRLYYATYDIAWHGKDVRSKYHRENISGPTSEFNGTSNLPWYVGLAFYGEGIDDEECKQMLRNGYDQHQKMTAHRAKMLGKSGGINSGTIGNGFENYPYAEYNFIYTMRSATGIDITPQMGYMLGYLRYIDWSRLPDNKEFGIGDSFHSDNAMPRGIVAHVKEIANLFAPTNPQMFDWFAGLLYRFNDRNNRYSSMQFMPLFHRYHFETDDAESVVDAKDKQSMHFEQLGQIVMRSGVGDKDTYAIFLTERHNRHRQH
jgi:heparin/heparan-sulfate lyase